MSRIEELAEERFGRGKLSCPDDIEGPAFEAGACAVLEECRKMAVEQCHRTIGNLGDWRGAPVCGVIEKVEKVVRLSDIEALFGAGETES